MVTAAPPLQIIVPLEIAQALASHCEGPDLSSLLLPASPRSEALLSSPKPAHKLVDMARQDSADMARQHSAPLAAKQLALRLMDSPLGAVQLTDVPEAQPAAKAEDGMPLANPGAHLGRCSPGLWQVGKAAAASAWPHAQPAQACPALHVLSRAVPLQMRMLQARWRWWPWSWEPCLPKRCAKLLPADQLLHICHSRPAGHVGSTQRISSHDMQAGLLIFTKA